jgi:hypothetical protein
MNAFLVALLAMALSYVIAWGQTNSPSPSLFSLPSAQLRPLETEVPHESTDARSDTDRSLFEADPIELDDPNADSVGLPNYAEKEQHEDQMMLVRYPGEFDYHTYRLVHENTVLKRDEPERDDFISRTVAAIFVPEPVKIGRTTVCCSLITAIKRKNPLCLFNPMVLNVSW